jgi:acetyl esterase/lipase
MMPELDDSYANAAYIPDADTYPPRWNTEAAAFRTALGARFTADVAYGTGPRQTYDLARCEGTPSGTLIFVHGGYWRAFDKSSWSQLAAGALAHGWDVALPSYDLCPTVRIATITQQIALAVTKIAAARPGPLCLAGHSAGGHLVARMMAPGMLPLAIQSRICHVMPISPLSDLRPLLQTSMNDDFGMDEATALAESPMIQPPPDAPVTVWVGAQERPVFLDQAAWLATAWNCQQVIAPDRHHFNVIEDLQDPDSDMCKRLFSL